MTNKYLPRKHYYIFADGPTLIVPGGMGGAIYVLNWEHISLFIIYIEPYNLIYRYTSEIINQNGYIPAVCLNHPGAGPTSPRVIACSLTSVPRNGNCLACHVTCIILYFLSNINSIKYFPCTYRHTHPQLQNLASYKTFSHTKSLNYINERISLQQTSCWVWRAA